MSAAFIIAVCFHMAALLPLGMPDLEAIGPHTIVVPFEQFQQVRYVSIQDGNDEEGTGSKEAPWKNLAYAIGQINDASTKNSYAILVAAGKYDHGVIKMKENVSLFGGFDPTTWERDVFKHPAVLSGGGVRRVVEGSNNCWLDGFVITEGCSQGPGAGILCEDASPHISNNTITANKTIEPTAHNPARIHQRGNDGGGMACLFNSYPIIENNAIYNNQTSVGTGAGVSFYGWIRPAELPRPKLFRNIIAGNRSGTTDFGRTRSNSGGAVSCMYEASPVIEENLIIGNSAGGRSDAGGVYCEYEASPLIKHNWILGNTSEDDGSAIYTMRDSEPSIESNVIMGNGNSNSSVVRVSKEGRAIINGNYIAHNQGGNAVQCTDGYMECTNNVITDNRLGYGLGISQQYHHFAPAKIANNMIQRNEKGAVIFSGNGEHSCVIENCAMDELPADKELAGIIVKATYKNLDEVSYTFQIESKMDDVDPGAVVRVGNVWGVISGRDSEKLTFIAAPTSTIQNNAVYELEIFSLPKES